MKKWVLKEVLMLKFLLIFSMVFPHTLFAAGSNERVYSKQLAAQATNAFLKKSKTVKEMVDSLSGFLTPTEFENTLTIIKENSIDMNAELPVFEISGNKLVYKSINLEFLETGRLSVNGVTLEKYQDGKFDLYLSYIIKLMKKPKSSALMSLVVPQAYAFGADGGPTLGIVLLIVGLRLAVPIAIGAAVVGAAATVIGGLVYLGKEIYESVRDGDVSCNGKNFEARKKTRNAALLATSKSEAIDLKIVTQILGKAVDACTPELAKDLKEKIMTGAKTAAGDLQKQPQYQPSTK